MPDTLNKVFIDVEVDESVASDATLAAKLVKELASLTFSSRDFRVVR